MDKLYRQIRTQPPLQFLSKGGEIGLDVQNIYKYIKRMEMEVVGSSANGILLSVGDI